MNVTDILYAKKLAGGGGGGSSDFSTAVVTITNNFGDSIHIETPIVLTNSDNEKQIICGLNLENDQTFTYTVVKGEGGLILFNGDGDFEVVSGNAEVPVDAPWTCEVFGDCVLNVVPVE